MSTTVLELLLLLAAANLCVQLFMGGFLVVFATLDSLVAPIRELLSLHPILDPDVDTSGEDYFHGYRILGRTPISRLQLWLLMLNLNLGMVSKPALLGVLCFVPRHGLRIGKTELLICFECLRGESYRGSRQRGSFGFWPFGAPFFNRILRAHGIPIASRAGGL